MQTLLDVIAKRKVDEHDELVVKLKKRVAYVKHNRKWRAEYMRLSIYEMDQQRRLEEAIKEGREKGIKRLISSLRDLDIDQDIIKQELKKQI